MRLRWSMNTSCTILWWIESSVFNTSITSKSEHNTVKSILIFYAFCPFPHSTTVPIYYFTYFRSPKWYISTSVFFNSTSNKYEILEKLPLTSRNFVKQEMVRHGFNSPNRFTVLSMLIQSDVGLRVSSTDNHATHK